MAHSFIAYVDESGDEGFKFRAPGVEGATHWFALSAVVIRRDHEPRAVSVINDVRQALNKPPLYTLHFRFLKHPQRVMFAQRIARRSALRLTTVLAHKPSLAGSTLVADSRLYFYATRILLERVSWICRDAADRYKNGDGTCHVVFSNRSNLSYEAMREYLTLLKDKSEELRCRIDWTVIRPDKVSSEQHNAMKGLQIADAVASSFFHAVEPDQWENTEDRYARTLLPRCYRYKGRLNRYGVKICCGNKPTEQQIEGSIPWLDLRS